MKFGLTKKNIQLISDTLKQFPEIEEALIFGSRAMRNHKPGSDIDLAIKGLKINIDTINRLKGILEDEVPLPYFFDIVHCNTNTEPALLEHIKQYGQKFYNRGKGA